MRSALRRIANTGSTFTLTRAIVFAIVVALVVGLVPSQLTDEVFAQSVEESADTAPETPVESPSPVAAPSETAPSSSPTPEPIPSSTPSPEPTAAATPPPAVDLQAPIAQQEVVPPAASAPLDQQKALALLDQLGPEIESERTLDAKVYSKPDGSRVAKVYGSPIHFEDATGKLRDINNNIVSDATGFKNTAGPIEVKFARRADAGELLNIKHGENQISFSLLNAAGSTGIPDGSVITYPAVRPGVDLKYVMSTEGVKEMLVLNERPASNADLIFRFVLNPNGLEPRATKRGGIDLVDQKGKTQFSIPAAVAWDSASPGIPLVNPEAAKLSLTRSGDQWFVDLKAESKYLAAAEFPVFLDPEVVIAQALGNVGDDGYISDAYPDGSYGSRWNGTFWTNLFGYFLPGQGDSLTGYQTYAKYDVSPYNNQKITWAYWYSYVTDAYPNPANYRMKPVNAPDWHSNTITWNNKPSLRTEQKTAQATKSTWQAVDFTDWVKKWTSQSWLNYGFMLDNNGSGSIVQIGAQEDPVATAFLYLSYQPNSPPSMPVLDSPAHGALISTLTPELRVKTATDPDNDPVTYSWTVFDENLTRVVHAVDGSTNPWITIPSSAGLVKGQKYKWIAATWDGHAASYDWNHLWEFTVAEDPGVPISSAVGLEDFFPYEAFPLGQGTAYANMASGNLVVQDTDFDAPGQGLNMRLVRTYNANADASNGVLGRGWRLGIAEGSAGSSGSSGSIDLMQLINVLWPSNVFDLTDIDGTKHHFVKQADGWHAPPGVNLTVTTSILGVFEFTRPDGVVYRFEATGANGAYRIMKIVDRKGNFLNFAYNAEKLASITDVTGRTLVFAQPANLVTNVTFNSGGSALSTAYGYIGDRLTSVTNAAGTSSAVTTEYTYSNEGLKTVKDARGNSTTFTIQPAAPGTPTRLTTISDRAGKEWSFSYTGGTCLPSAPATVAVCLTDPESKTSLWSTNDQGNLRSRRDAGDKNAAGADRFNTESFDWATNRLTSNTDQAGNTTTYSYNPLGQISGSVSNGSSDPTFTSNFDFQYPAPGVGEMIKATTAAGTAEQRIWDFTYDAAKGTLLTSEDPLDKLTRMTYYARGMLKSVEDANGKVTTYGDTALPDGGYHASGQPGRITDPLGKVTSFSYDFLGFQKTRVDRKSQTWTTDYDLRGNLLSSVTPVGDTTSFCYDANDNQSLVMPPRTASRSCSLDGTDGHSTKSTFDVRDLLSSTVTKSEGQIRKSTYAYYDDGQLKEILEPRSFDPDSGALLATVQKASYLRYPNNRVSAFIDEEGDQTDVLYTPHGLPQVVTDPAGDAGRHTVSYSYNRLGQVKSAQESGHAQAMRYDYNLHGDTTKQTTPRDTFTLFNPDKMGRPLTITDPNSKVTTREYDNVGNLKMIRQPTGAGAFTTASYFYTARNEIDYETDPADALHFIDYVYDDEGRQSLRHDRLDNGATGTIERTTEQLFRADGRISESKASGPGLSEQRSVFGYDPDGNATSVSTYKDGSATPNVSELTAGYTGAGELKDWSEKIYPPTGAPITKTGSHLWAQDGLQASNSVDGQESDSAWFLDGNEKSFTPYGGFGDFTSTYYGNGAPNVMTFPNAAQLTQRYNTADLATSRMFTNSSGTKLSAWEAIGYDENNNRKTETVTQAQPAGASPAVQTGAGSFDYDLLDRMKSFKHPFETTTASYGLDDAGNVTSEPEATFSFANNRITGRTPALPASPSAYGYDHFGNQVSDTEIPLTPTTTSYNAASQTKRVTASDGTWVEYSYDGLERMVSRTDETGAVVLFFHDGFNDQIAVETDAAGTVGTRYLVDSFGVARGKLDIGNSTGRSYYMTDPRANVTQMIGASDQAVKAVFAYDPYGKDKAALSKKIAESNWDSRLKFQMAPRDPKTGSYSIGSRLMNPTINRFVGSDSYVASGAKLGLQADPLTGNRYLYAGANPAGLIDDGHGAQVPCGLVVCEVETETQKEEKEKKKGRPLLTSGGPPVYVTYIKTNPITGLKYVGRAAGYGDPDEIVRQRDKNHHKTEEGYGKAELDRYSQGTKPFFARAADPAYQAIRGREQQMIDAFGRAWSDTGGRDDPTKRRTGNEIRGVSKWNPLGRIYHDAATRAFGEAYEYTGYL